MAGFIPSWCDSFPTYASFTTQQCQNGVPRRRFVTSRLDISPSSHGGALLLPADASSTTTTTALLSSAIHGNNDFDSVLSNTDIAVGVVLALLLAALATFLQNQRSQNDFDLGQPEPLRQEMDESKAKRAVPNNNNNNTTSFNTTTSTFEDWKEMSKPENYIWYNTKLRQRKSAEASSFSLEQRWVLIALIILFAPIFSFEFFLTISRQIICLVSRDLCLPYNID